MYVTVSQTESADAEKGKYVAVESLQYAQRQNSGFILTLIAGPWAILLYVRELAKLFIMVLATDRFVFAGN